MDVQCLACVSRKACWRWRIVLLLLGSFNGYVECMESVLEVPARTLKLNAKYLSDLPALAARKIKPYSFTFLKEEVLGLNLLDCSMLPVQNVCNCWWHLCRPYLQRFQPHWQKRSNSACGRGLWCVWSMPHCGQATPQLVSVKLWSLLQVWTRQKHYVS